VGISNAKLLFGKVMDVEVPSLLYDTDPADRLKEDADDQMRPTVSPAASSV
jgi:hypothetical protein